MGASTPAARVVALTKCDEEPENHFLQFITRTNVIITSAQDSGEMSERVLDFLRDGFTQDCGFDQVCEDAFLRGRPSDDTVTDIMKEEGFVSTMDLPTSPWK